MKPGTKTQVKRPLPDYLIGNVIIAALGIVGLGHADRRLTLRANRKIV
jgi:hypothetical protein